MTMRLAALGAILTIALIAWLVSAVAVERQCEAHRAAWHADYRVCARVNPGPLRPPRRPNAYSHNSELV